MTFEFTEEDMLSSKQVRDQLVNKVEILDRVREVILIPQIDMVTMGQIAEYYDVKYETVRKCYQRHHTEFLSDGAINISASSVILATKDSIVLTKRTRGYTEIHFTNGTSLVASNLGVVLLPRQSIVRFGMLFRDSRIAKSVRMMQLKSSY